MLKLGKRVFECSNFKGVDLRNFNLKGVDLRGANLEGADLTGADLSASSLIESYIYNTKGIIQWESPLGERRICYSVKHDDCVMHKLGCFWGSTHEAVTKIQEKYGKNSLYEEALLLQVKILENRDWIVSNACKSS